MAGDWQTKIMKAVDTRNAVLLEELTKIYNNSMLDFQFRGRYQVANRIIILAQDTPLTRGVKNGYYKIIEQLLNAGANVEHPGNYGETPLMMAASRGDLDICRLLLRSGANIRTSDIFGRTPLHHAIMSNHHSIVALFLEHEALYFNSKKQLNEWLLCKGTPLYFAIFYNRSFVMEQLLNHLETQGWDIPLQSIFRLTSSVSEDCTMSLLQRGHNPLQRNCSEPVESCFEIAAEEGLIQLMRSIIELNPMFLQEDWLVKNKIPTKLTKHADFLSWLFQHRAQPPQLTHLCRTVILVELGQNYLPKIGELPLPKLLKAFLGVVKQRLNTSFEL